MFKKLGAIGALALGLSAAALSPAHAAGGDGDINQDIDVVTIQICSTDIAILGIVIPIASPETVGHCGNAESAQVND
ncbi:hypothetical protein [Allonocardiopsis opalescens]|uniref:Small secreted domain DUF320 n=1 Tax=Allonocardiopsis opalescens TaxID=1144618 RepID=A0A2T0Q7Z7_9ACTN|nr:hypothetical protein [Allonocardiopsis opalescens]PRX99944.1 hypothetical protein CLV72_103552 [Allonocardiopsis opalescens]